MVNFAGTVTYDNNVLGKFILSVVFNEKMQRTLNALFAEDPLLSKR